MFLVQEQLVQRPCRGKVKFRRKGDLKSGSELNWAGEGVPQEQWGALQELGTRGLP